MVPRQLPIGPRFFAGVSTLVYVVVSLLVLILAIVIWWRIFSKAGYSGALGLLMFVPIANLVLLLVLAFGTWPIEQEVERLRGTENRTDWPQ